MKILVLSLIGASILAAQQQPRRRFDNNDPGHGIERRLTGTLGLNATQQNKIHTILSERDVIAKGSHEQMQALNKQMVAAIRTGNEGQIDQLSQEIASQHQKQTSLHGKTMAKIYATLTPEQQSKVGQNLEMFREGPGFGERPGFNRRGPGPHQTAPAPAAQ